MAKNKQKVNKKNDSVYNKKGKVQETPIGISKVIKCVIAVFIVFGLFYLLTLYLTDRNLRSSVKVSEARIQYEIILAGESFQQNGDDYMILYFDEENIGDYSTALSEYNDKNSKVSLYKCYTNEALNKKFIASDNNKSKSPEKIEELKVEENTLIRFKDHKVVEYITGRDDIVSYLKSL